MLHPPSPRLEILEPNPLPAIHFDRLIPRTFFRACMYMYGKLTLVDYNHFLLPKYVLRVAHVYIHVILDQVRLKLTTPPITKIYMYLPPHIIKINMRQISLKQ